MNEKLTYMIELATHLKAKFELTDLEFLVSESGDIRVYKNLREVVKLEYLRGSNGNLFIRQTHPNGIIESKNIQIPPHKNRYA